MTVSLRALLLLLLCVLLQSCSLNLGRWWSEPKPDVAIVANMNKEVARSNGHRNSGPCYVPDSETVFFAGWDAEHGVELWKTRVGASKAYMVADALPGKTSSKPLDLTAWKEMVYFAALSSDSKRFLWKSDGTPEGTVPIIPPSSEVAPRDPHNFVATEDYLFFYAYTSKGSSMQVWRTDGTSEGTFPLYTYPRSNSYNTGLKRDYSFRPDIPFALGNQVIWAVESRRPSPRGQDNCELWRSDGTLEGTERFSSANSPRHFMPVGNSAFFWGVDGYRIGPICLMKTDGITSTPIRLGGPFTYAGLSFQAPRKGSGASSSLKEDGTIPPVEQLLFPAFQREAEMGYEPWFTDGTTSGTTLYRDIVPGKASSSPADFMRFRNKHFFTAIDPEKVRKLWVTKGPNEDPLPLVKVRTPDLPPEFR